MDWHSVKTYRISAIFTIFAPTFGLSNNWRTFEARSCCASFRGFLVHGNSDKLTNLWEVAAGQKTKSRQFVGCPLNVVFFARSVLASPLSRYAKMRNFQTSLQSTQSTNVHIRRLSKNRGHWKMNAFTNGNMWTGNRHQITQNSGFL